jgi:hypothetical protein
MNTDFVEFLFDLLQGRVRKVTVHSVENRGSGKFASWEISETGREGCAADNAIP